DGLEAGRLTSRRLAAPGGVLAGHGDPLASPSGPHDDQTGDAFHGAEVVVLRDDGKVVRQCGGGDPEVVDVQAASRLGEVNAQPRPRRGDAIVDAEQL